MSGDRRGQAWALQNLAWVATTLGDFATSDAILGRAARLFAELGDTTGRAWLRGTTAFTRLLAGRLHEARRLAHAFLPFGERVGEKWAVGTLRAVAAFAAAELGDLAEADREARRAFHEFDETDDDWGRAFALVVRGVVARGLGEYEHAIDLLGEACRYSERTGHPLLLGIAHTIRGFASARNRRRGLGRVRCAHGARRGEAARRGRGGSGRAKGAARLRALAQGDIDAALSALREVAENEAWPSVLLSRRQAVAEYAVCAARGGSGRRGARHCPPGGRAAR